MIWAVMGGALLGGMPALVLWAQDQGPGTDLVRSGYAQVGFLALLLAGGVWVIKQADKRTTAAQEACKAQLAEANARTEMERQARLSAEADSRAVRDSFIKDVVPTITLQTARSDQLLTGLQQVVGVVERVMNSALDRPK